tara:strand:- start:7662 stop:8867 length:1206 start_codon:yes stop_codon:yes gene_type:complete
LIGRLISSGFWIGSGSIVQIAFFLILFNVAPLATVGEFLYIQGYGFILGQLSCIGLHQLIPEKLARTVSQEENYYIQSLFVVTVASFLLSIIIGFGFLELPVFCFFLITWSIALKIYIRQYLLHLGFGAVSIFIEVSIVPLLMIFYLISTFLFGTGLNYIVETYAFFSLISLWALTVYSKGKIDTESEINMRSLFVGFDSIRKSLVLVPVGLIRPIVNRADGVLIAPLVGLEAAAVFGVAQKLTMLIGVLSSVANSTFFPSINRLVTTGSINGVSSILIRHFIFLALSCGGVVLFFYFFGDWVLGVMFKEGADRAADYIIPLCVVHFLVSISIPFNVFFVSIGRAFFVCSVIFFSAIIVSFFGILNDVGSINSILSMMIIYSLIVYVFFLFAYYRCRVSYD